MPDKIDRDLFHEYLWKHTDRVGRLRLNQSQLARDLALDRTTVARIMMEFVAAGRVKKMVEGRGKIILYHVTDPEAYKWKTI